MVHTNYVPLSRVGTDGWLGSFLDRFQILRRENHQPLVTPTTIAAFVRIIGQFSQYMSVRQFIGFTKKMNTPSQKTAITATTERISFGIMRLVFLCSTPKISHACAWRQRLLRRRRASCRRLSGIWLGSFFFNHFPYSQSHGSGAAARLCAAIRQTSVSGKSQSTASSSLPECRKPVANVARFGASDAEAAHPPKHRGNAPRYLRQTAPLVSGSLLVLHAPKNHNQVLRLFPKQEPGSLLLIAEFQSACA